MNKLLLACGALSLFGGLQAAQAATADYNIVTTWYEPDTQPKNSIFTGSFTWDDATHAVTNLQGTLSESMTGTFPMPVDGPNAPYYDQTLLNLTYTGFADTQWHDATLGGTFAAVFLKDSRNTYSTLLGGDGWSPASGVQNQGLYHGFPGAYASSIQNAYALIFVPDNLSTANTAANPLTLTWNEAAGTGSLGLAHTSYADCAPGGMMGAVCMSSWSVAAYGAVGTMSGYPLSQTITAAVPEPETYATLMAGLAMMGFVARRRRNLL